MELDGRFFSETQLWWLGLIYLAALLVAIWVAPWKKLLNTSNLNVFLGAIVTLVMLWHLRGEVQPGLYYHLLGVTTLTLMFGWSFALIAVTIVLVAVGLNMNTGLDGMVASAITAGLAPVTLSQLSLVLARTWLPKHFFIYVLGNGFITAWVVATICGHLAVWLLVMSGGYTSIQLETTIKPFFIMMFFPEGIINGWIITILVLYCPQWVYSFNDDEYVRGK